MMPKKKDNQLIDLPTGEEIPIEDEGIGNEDKPQSWPSNKSINGSVHSETQAFPLPDPVAENTPSLIGKATEVQLRKGYVFIKKIGKDSIIQVAAKQVGTVFKSDEWEVLSEKKK